MSESNNIKKNCDMSKNNQYHIPSTEIVSFDCRHNISKKSIINNDCSKCEEIKDYQNKLYNLIPDFPNIKDRHLF